MPTHSLYLAQIVPHRWSSDLLNIFQFTLISLAVFVFAIKVIDWATPGKLVHEILENGNIALGTYLAGSIIGLGFVMQAILSTPTDLESGAFRFTGNDAWDAIFNTVMWGMLAPFVQVLAMRIFDWITPGLDFRTALAQDNRAVGIMLGALNIAVGLVLAALFVG